MAPSSRFNTMSEPKAQPCKNLCNPTQKDSEREFGRLDFFFVWCCCISEAWGDIWFCCVALCQVSKLHVCPKVAITLIHPSGFIDAWWCALAAIEFRQLSIKFEVDQTWLRLDMVSWWRRRVAELHCVSGWRKSWVWMILWRIRIGRSVSLSSHERPSVCWEEQNSVATAHSFPSHSSQSAITSSFTFSTCLLIWTRRITASLKY